MYALAPERNSCARAPQFPSRPLRKGQETFTSHLLPKGMIGFVNALGHRGVRGPRVTRGGLLVVSGTGNRDWDHRGGVGAPGRLQTSTGWAPGRAVLNKAGQAAASRARVQR